MSKSDDIARAVLSAQVDKEVEEMRTSVVLLYPSSAEEWMTTKEFEGALLSILRMGVLMKISILARFN